MLDKRYTNIKTEAKVMESWEPVLNVVNYDDCNYSGHLDHLGFPKISTVA